MVNLRFYQNGGIPVIFSSDQNRVNLINWAKDNTSFNAEHIEVFYLPNPESGGSILVGLNADQNLTFDELRYLGFKIYKTANANKISEIEITMPPISEKCDVQVMQSIAEGMIQATYKFDRYLSEKSENPVKKLTINYTPDNGSEEKMQDAFNKLKDIMDGVFLARNLVNQTSNYIYPETLAQAAADSLQHLGVEVRVYNREQIKEIGMEAFLAVAQGSSKEPKLIVMKYQGNPNSEQITGLVGKGITYDSGGYSIKPSDGMLSMHCDMGGAGTVIGTMYALAKTKAETNAYGVIAACENLISGTSFKVGDIINSLSGKTIEIGNTDAEGRVTLADAVYYATNNLKVDQVIDLATLTGACLVALGEEYTGVITNNNAFYQRFEAAANKVGEKVWLLPNDKKLAEANKSRVADIKNVGGRLAGTITGGQFIGEFVANNTPWIHLDIAGTAYLSKENDYLPERATGVHVKTLVELLSAN
ncbi:MAG TPA: leucyl aminopeptidase [Clostridiaceae bacterium]|nr:leucyl aminopeptidase [Clostridiaceae bacterium]